MAEAAELDRTFLLAQLLRGNSADDLETQPHRDDLDSQLTAPVGKEAEALARLEAYLKG